MTSDKYTLKSDLNSECLVLEYRVYVYVYIEVGEVYL